jgi:hypothetical protein
MDDKYLSELDRGNREILARARDLEQLLTSEQLQWQPPGGGWSAGQVIEHIVVTGHLYVDRIDALIEKARRDGVVKRREWKPTLMGGMIMRAVNPRSVKRFRTQRVFEPGPAPREGVIRAMLQLHEKIGAQLAAADGLDLRSIRVTSPVSSLIRMNLGDAFGILVFHGQRHLLQVGRVITAEGFPRGS